MRERAQQSGLVSHPPGVSPSCPGLSPGSLGLFSQLPGLVSCCFLLPAADDRRRGEMGGTSGMEGPPEVGFCSRFDLPSFVGM